MGRNLGTRAKELLAPRVGSDEGGCAVEVSGFGGGREDVREEEVAHAARGDDSYKHNHQIETLLCRPHCLLPR